MNAQIRQNAQGYLVSHFAAAVVRDVTGWTAAELDITGAADVEEPALDPSDLDDDDPDATATDDSDEAPQLAPVSAADPVGDPDLLSDLGVPASRLLALCGREGMLPADVTAEVCQLVGCGDEVEELREA